MYYSYDNFEVVNSDIDGKSYKVQNNENENFENKKAADFLARLNKDITFLVDYMYEHREPDDESAVRLYERWKYCTLREISKGEDSVAYTVNKGDEMRICIRHNDEFQEFNTALFVILHELGHIMSVSFGHNDEFYENFSFLVHLASSLGIYKPQDFSSEPEYYCGTQINTSPCSDGSCNFNRIKIIV